ncbi:MAG TPA: response regulator [Anaerolineae bacterium]|nr:response regulator [Anaerolineae bacterium]
MAGKKYRVVWIEDDPELLRLGRLILSHKGYEVVTVNDSRAGYEIILREQPDAILLDLMMPEVDGWDVYNQIKATPELRNTPVIVVTAKAQAADKALALHLAKVDGYLTKPYEQSQLLDLLNEVLKRKQALGG